LYTSRRDKCRLIRRNKVMKQTFKTISQDFGDDLVDNITETNRPKMTD
jgi:hypothetical protein